jgi:aspartyl-tRNA(Asn)/glutamyl-tRNA(Gln) amidotransferase subunit C
MWDNERHEITRKIACGPGEMSIDGGREGRGRSRVPRAGDGGRANASRLSALSHDGMLAFAMPAELTRAQVEAIAALAHLELDPEEVEMFARQLGDILAYADQLQQVDTSGVPPTAYGAGPHSVDRPDRVVPSLAIADVFANAPDCDQSRPEGGFFKVPRIIG